MGFTSKNCLSAHKYIKFCGKLYFGENFKVLNYCIFSVPGMTPLVVSQSIPSVTIPHPKETPGQFSKFVKSPPPGQFFSSNALPPDFLDTLCFCKFSTTFKISVVKLYPMNIYKFEERTYIYQ